MKVRVVGNHLKVWYFLKYERRLERGKWKKTGPCGCSATEIVKFSDRNNFLTAFGTNTISIVLDISIFVIIVRLSNNIKRRPTRCDVTIVIIFPLTKRYFVIFYFLFTELESISRWKKTLINTFYLDTASSNTQFSHSPTEF